MREIRKLEKEYGVEISSFAEFQHKKIGSSAVATFANSPDEVTTTCAQSPDESEFRKAEQEYLVKKVEFQKAENASFVKKVACLKAENEKLFINCKVLRMKRDWVIALCRKLNLELVKSGDDHTSIIPNSVQTDA